MAILFVAAFLIASIYAQCPADKFCTSCSGNRCLFCVNSYISGDGICVAGDKNITNCYSYKSLNVCAVCNDGFYLTKLSTCASIATANCLVSSSSTPAACTVCANGNVPTATGLCTTGTSCSVNNCSNCTKVGVCAICKAGFSVTETGACIAAPVSNCLKTSRGYCSVCERGYYHDNVQCVKTNVQGSIVRLAVSLIGGIIALIF